MEMGLWVVWGVVGVMECEEWCSAVVMEMGFWIVWGGG